MLGVVKLAPVPNNVPADAASYQSMVVPAALVADIVTVPVPHLEPLTGAVAAAGTAFIVAVTAVLVAEIQPVVVFLAWA
jgi:hypothetical protein